MPRNVGLSTVIVIVSFS